MYDRFWHMFIALCIPHSTCLSNAPSVPSSQALFPSTLDNKIQFMSWKHISGNSSGPTPVTLLTGNRSHNLPFISDLLRNSETSETSTRNSPVREHGKQWNHFLLFNHCARLRYLPGDFVNIYFNVKIQIETYSSYKDCRLRHYICKVPH